MNRETYVGQSVDAEYLMVKGSIMEEVEREFQAQVSSGSAVYSGEVNATIAHEFHHSWRSSHSDTLTKRKSRKANLHKHAQTSTNRCDHNGHNDLLRYKRRHTRAYKRKTHVLESQLFS